MRRGIRVGKKSRPAVGARRRKTPAPTKVVVKAAPQGKMLDASAAAWRRLLADPCGALMSAPCYSGMGTGSYVRVRQISTIGGNDTSGVVSFQFSGNSTWSFGTSTGANVTTGIRAFAFNASTIITDGVESRCIAGCVRVRYLGSESNRSGMIGMLTGTPAIGPNTVTSNPVSVYLSQMPLVHRTGEVVHEAKFVPTSRDELFTAQTSSNAFFEPAANCITVVYTGVPAGTLQFEITAVYELDPTSTAQLKNSLPPQSTNTTNQVLASLGPVANWAYSNLGAPIIKAAVGYAQTLVKPSVIQGVARGLSYAAAL